MKTRRQQKSISMYEVREQTPGLMAHEKGKLVRVFPTYSEASSFIELELEEKTERSKRLYTYKTQQH